MNDDLIDAMKNSIANAGIKACIAVMGIMFITLISSVSTRMVVVELEVFEEVIFYNIVDENPDMANRIITFEIHGDCVNFRLLNEGWYVISSKGRIMMINTSEVQTIQFRSFPGYGHCNFELSYNVV